MASEHARIRQLQSRFPQFEWFANEDHFGFQVQDCYGNWIHLYLDRPIGPTCIERFEVVCRRIERGDTTGEVLLWLPGEALLRGGFGRYPRD